MCNESIMCNISCWFILVFTLNLVVAELGRPEGLTLNPIIYIRNSGNSQEVFRAPQIIFRAIHVNFLNIRFEELKHVLSLI